MSFAYNDAGLRISKAANDVTTHYVYDGSLLAAEYTNNETIVYIYDAFDSPIGFAYRSSSYNEDTWDVYWYEKNLQGDTVAVYSSTGTKLVSYTYTAWGDFTTTYHNGGASTTAVKNNLTYRGYYYDSDLGMYYLQSRYYDPVVGRFISPDSLMSGVNGSLHGFNLYAYCFNSPVSYTDSEGNWPEWMEDAYEWLNGKKEEAEEALEGVINFVEEKVEQVTDWYNEKNSFDPEDADAEFSDSIYYYQDSNYNLINADEYALYLKENYYQDSDRTVGGLYVELQFHYFAYLLGDRHALDGAYLGEPSMSGDWSAYISEKIGSWIKICP